MCYMHRLLQKIQRLLQKNWEKGESSVKKLVLFFKINIYAFCFLLNP